MNFFTLLKVELLKLRRSKIFWILLAPIVMMWVPSIVNADMSFDIRGIHISPEDNFFIQGFMGMMWFMLPATLVICTVLLTQTERANRGLLKMLSLPVSPAKLCLAKFTVLLLLAILQMCMTVGAYFISAAVASHMQSYDFMLDPLYVFRSALAMYASAIPMAAVFWLLATLISTPVFSVGAGLASIVPSVLVLNTKIWFLYPMCYPFYVLMTEYGKAAEGMFTATADLLPWLPVAAAITIVSLAVSCKCFGAAERRM